MPYHDALDEALDALEVAIQQDATFGWGQGNIAAARAAVRRLVEQGEEFVVMRVNGVEDANDPYGQRYIKSMLVINSDLSGDQGREFRITDGDRVRVTRLPGKGEG